jgi:hypothetical protein
MQSQKIFPEEQAIFAAECSYDLISSVFPKSRLALE